LFVVEATGANSLIFQNEVLLAIGEAQNNDQEELFGVISLTHSINDKEVDAMVSIKSRVAPSSACHSCRDCAQVAPWWVNRRTAS
jgi:hypothetical protein